MREGERRGEEKRREETRRDERNKKVEIVRREEK
jgi:hypothetical protein